MNTSARPVMPPIIDGALLAERLTTSADRRDLVVADVRWYLDGRDGRAAYEAGHIDGAVFVDLETNLAAHDLPATEGRHPLPTPEHFAAAMSALGIGDSTTVVAYDDTGGVTAGRLVVMLRMIGRDATLLEGGLHAWNGAVVSGPAPVAVPAPFTPVPWPADRLASAADAVDLAARGGVVLDARAAERFTGALALIDPRPGHIPGARNAPWASVLDESGRLADDATLRAHYAGLGAVQDGDAIAYCGSGVSACVNILAMERIGLRPPRLYVASWSGYAADPHHEAATGE